MLFWVVMVAGFTDTASVLALLFMSLMIWSSMVASWLEEVECLVVDADD